MEHLATILFEVLVLIFTGYGNQMGKRIEENNYYSLKGITSDVFNFW